MLRRVMMAGSVVVDPLAASIYAKITEWWSMEILTSGQMVGLHNGTSLSRVNAPILTTGKIGNGIDFESTSQQGLYADSNPPGSRTSTTSMTWGCWYKPESLPGCTLVNVAVRDNMNGSQRRLNLYLHTDGKLYGMAGNGTTLFQAATAEAASVGVFHFMQGEVVPGAQLRARIDNGAWAAVTGPASLPTSNLGIRMGFNRRSSDGAHEFYADGILDEVFLLDGTLTSDEWAYLYNGGAGRSYAQVKAAAGH